MSVNVKADIQQIYREWNNTLMEGMKTPPPSVRGSYCTDVPGNGRYTVLSWMLNQFRPRRWTGQRVYRGMSTQAWTVVHDERYELSYEFDRDEIEDDLTGTVQGAVANARNNVIKWQQNKDYLTALALEAGSTTLCHDGQNMWDDAHPIDVDGVGSASTYDNDISLALNNTNLNTAIDTLASIVAEDGMPILSEEPLQLHVPIALRKAALEATYDGIVSTAAARGLFSANAPAPNLLNQAVKVNVNPYLNLDGANPTAWYLTRKDGILQPVLLVVRREVESYEQGVGSEVYHEEGKIRFLTNARHKTSYSKPSLGLRSVG